MGYRQFWEGSFQRLDALLDELKPEKRLTKRGGRDDEHWKPESRGASDREIVMTLVFDVPRNLCGRR